ncbi:MAG: hypothetical protein DMG39_24560 [Acidobacteria bacterium]|nr:MAG: hypothetical protein DMG39_24560 [Acidobacteriota bacterium]
MFGERAEVAAVPGIRNAASGTRPPRSAAWEVGDRSKDRPLQRQAGGSQGQEGKKVMSCSRMEKKILGYVDGRLKESERLEVEKHLAACAGCRLRANEFRAVSGLLDELPMIEPSEAFDLRVHARVAAEPLKQSWWAWFTSSPRVAVAAAMLLLASVWVGTHSTNNQPQIAQEDIPVLENLDVLSSFDVLSELPPPVQADDGGQQQNPQM